MSACQYQASQAAALCYAGLAGAFTVCVVAAVLVFATQLIQHMPHNALGAIVLSGVAGILQFGEVAFLWRVRLYARVIRLQICALDCPSLHLHTASGCPPLPTT